MSCASHHGRLMPLLGALLCVAVLVAAGGAFAEGKGGVNAKPDGWLVNYGQPSIAVPDSFWAHFGRGQELMLARDFEGAAGELLRCITLFEPYTGSREKRGNYTDTLALEAYFLPLARAAVNLGHSLEELGRLDTAIKLYTGAADVAPGFAPAHSSLGLALVQRAWAHYTARVAARVGIGDVRPDSLELDTYQTAVAHLHVARQLEPDNVDVRIGLAVALRRWGVVDGAVVHARKATELEPTNAKAFYQLGLAEFAKGDIGPATEAFRTAVTNAKDDPEPFQAELNNALGLSLASGGDFKEALVAYRKAATLDPTNASYANNVGAALRATGQPGEAASQHMAAAALDPGTIQYQLNTAAALRDTGDLSGAIESYREALRLSPRNVETRRLRRIPPAGLLGDLAHGLPVRAYREADLHDQFGVTLYQRSDLIPPIARLAEAKAEALTRDDVMAALGTIAMHFARARRVNSVDAMDPRCYDVTPALAMRPNPWPALRTEMGMLWNQLGREPYYGQARVKLQAMLVDFAKIEPVVLKSAAAGEHAIEVKASGADIMLPLTLAGTAGTPAAAPELPDDVKEAVVSVAAALARADDSQEAVGELRWAHSLNPTSALIANNLGKALFDAGHVNGALAMYNAALARSADIAEVHFNRGVALATLKRMDEAIMAWQHALDLGMQDPRLYTYLGFADIQKTEFAYASAMFKRALALKNDYAPANYYLGLLEALQKSASPLTARPLAASRFLTPLGKPHYDVRAEFITDTALTDARAALMNADRLDPDRKEMYYYAGVELGLQDPNLATVKGCDVIHCVTRGWGLMPDWAAVTNNVAVILTMEGNPVRAEDLLRVATMDQPAYALAHWNLGRVLLINGKEAEGRAELSKGQVLAAQQHLPYFLWTAGTAPVPTAGKPGVAPPPQEYVGAKLPREAAEEVRLKALLQVFGVEPREP
jgi:tetratricopeptide (TPR) repeat protein